MESTEAEKYVDHHVYLVPSRTYIREALLKADPGDVVIFRPSEGDSACVSVVRHYYGSESLDTLLQHLDELEYYPAPDLLPGRVFDAARAARSQIERAARSMKIEATCIRLVGKTETHPISKTED